MFLGTHRDNARDMAAKGRNFYLRGSESPLAKVDESKAAVIRRMYIERTGTVKAVVSRVRDVFGIQRSQFFNIVTGRHW